MAFKEGVVLGTVSLNATGSGTTNIGGTSNTGTISIGNGSSGAIAIDCGTAGISVGTTANAHTTTIGSINTTSATTVQAGNGALNITSTNGTITVNAGVGTIGIGTDATNATYNFGTGTGNKLVTLGSTSGTSSLSLKTGTADFSLASATGTLMNALDTGEITYPLQPAFLAYNSSTDNNQTGNGTNATVQFDTEVFDRNSDFSSNTFTAPVTGIYHFNTSVIVGNTNATSGIIKFNSSNRIYQGDSHSPNATKNASGFVGYGLSSYIDMDRGDTVIVQMSTSGSGADNNSIFGEAGPTTFFCGKLVC